jgi:P27 family predicted phage terminase small subunit
MARPAKIIDVQTSHNTKKDIEKRAKIEEELKGENAVLPPEYLTDEQKEIFKRIVGVLKDMLGELDVYVLSEAAVTIDRLRIIEEKINADDALIIDKDVVVARKTYVQEFFRCCNELCLSPQSRAKIGSLATARKEKETDPLLKLLSGESSG